MRRLAGLLLALLALPALGSDGPSPTILGARGAVALPAAGDPHTAFRMPSGLGWSLEHNIELDLFVAWFRSSAQNALNDLEKEGVGGAASLGAVIVPDPDGPLVFHLGFYPELGAISPARTRVRYESFPGIGLRVDTMFVTLAGSMVYTPVSWLSFGISLQVSPGITKQRLLLGGGGQTLELAGSPKIGGVPLPGDPSYADFLQLVPAPTSGRDPTLVYRSRGKALHLGGLLSMTLFPVEQVAIGFSWRPRSFEVIPFRGEAQIDAQATVDSAIGGLAPPVRNLFLATLPDGGRNGFKATYKLEQKGPYIPQTARLSLAVWPKPALLIAAEVAWTDWHGAFEEALVTLSRGSNADFNHVLGSDRVTVRAKTRWKSRWTASAQVAWGATDRLTVRGGFHLGQSPLNPKVVGSVSTPSFACTSLFAGGGWQLTSDVQLNMLVEWALPTKARSGLGTGSPTTEGTRYTSDQVVLHLGLSLWF